MDHNQMDIREQASTNFLKIDLMKHCVQTPELASPVLGVAITASH